MVPNDPEYVSKVKPSPTKNIERAVSVISRYSTILGIPDSSLGYPQLIKIFASPRASFPRFLARAQIKSFFIERAFPEKKLDSRFLIERAFPEKARRRRKFWIFNLGNDRIPSLETAFLMYNPYRKCNKISKQLWDQLRFDMRVKRQIQKRRKQL